MIASTIPFNEILCLIPMKAVEDAKKRLRISFPSQKQGAISNIISKLFLNSITTVKQFVDFAVVSPSEETLELALEQGSSFIYQDLGIDLNDALSTSIDYACTTGKWRYVLILTADLPFLTVDSFRLLSTKFQPESITILAAPSRNNSQGTSGLLIPLSIWNSFTLQFGSNSFFKFSGLFTDSNIPFYSIHDTIGFDLDTIDDLIEFKTYSTTNFDLALNHGEINELFST